MDRSQARVGMKVVFGHPNGEKTTGEITKVNPKSATIKSLEERGTGRGSSEGATWKVHYSLMEPAPANGDKTTVEIKRPLGKQIVPGETTFRYTYADGNPLWKVVSRQGSSAFVCEIMDERVVIDGKTYPSDFSGTRKAFATTEILRAIAHNDFFENVMEDSDKFYASLKEGQYVHYSNGFGSWLRCKVVKGEKENDLLPIALLGSWQKYDLPYRRPDGTICNGYHADQIFNKKTFHPHSSTIFEGGYKSHGDPTNLPDICLDVPPMTAEEVKIAKQWQKVQSIRELTDQRENPGNILTLIKAIVTQE